MIPIQLTKAVVENGSDVSPFPPSQYTSAPSAISAGYLPIRIRRPFRIPSSWRDAPFRTGSTALHWAVGSFPWPKYN
ncbi:MAG: hypothetical protein ACOX52_01015 [Verrucomicrobiota bacterium]